MSHTELLLAFGAIVLICLAIGLGSALALILWDKWRGRY